jgi:hypothetical protein
MLSHVAAVGRDCFEFAAALIILALRRLLGGKFGVTIAEVHMALSLDAEAHQEVSPLRVAVPDSGQTLLDAANQAAEAGRQGRFVIDGLVVATGHDHVGIEILLGEGRNGGVVVERLLVIRGRLSRRVVGDYPRTDDQFAGIDHDRAVAAIVGAGLGGPNDIRLAGSLTDDLRPDDVLGRVVGNRR